MNNIDDVSVINQAKCFNSNGRRIPGVSQAVQRAYAIAGGRPVKNRDLYRTVAHQLSLDFEEFLPPKVTVSEDQPEFSANARTVRWVQQTLKTRGLLERSDLERGVWNLTPKGKLRLRHIDQNQVLVAFHTRLGVALLADCRTGAQYIDEPISLLLTSPPYCLSKVWGRAYGSPKVEDYVDFICDAIEPIIGKLMPGASIALNISNDIFERGSPARSLYPEYLTIALSSRFNLSLMDRLIWNNPTKPPGPTAWASLKRVQLNATFETVLWFTTDPHRCFSDNRRVLEPHTDRHLKFIKAGGENRFLSSSDGAHVVRPGDYANVTAGRIPRNVLCIPHGCADQRRYKAAARAAGLPAHGAPFPLRLAEFLISFLTMENQIVFDPFGGSQTTGRAAENLNRRWITTELVADYARGGAFRFGAADDLWINPDLDLALGGHFAGVGRP